MTAFAQNTRYLLAEGLGTALLLATITGAGIMAERLADGNVAIALLGDALPTSAMLFVLIMLFGPVSGAHLNPAVTLASLFERQTGLQRSLTMIAAQIIGAVAGVWLAHMMYDLPILQSGVTARMGPGAFLSEIVATFGLIFLILRMRGQPLVHTAAMVGLYIGAAFWFTASTSFANPAVTIARALTESFAGIDPANVLPFIAAQLVGTGLAIAISRAFDHQIGT